jgi:tripartite-type tricarboxylate transporter receptor subunit TctC
MQPSAARLLAIASALTFMVGANAQEPFFAGKQIQFAIAGVPGDGYDLWGRLVQRYMPRHLPGEPQGVAQNMPGAGGLTATNYIFTVAPKDGTAIAAIPRDIPFAPLMNLAGGRFDAQKLSYVGTPTIDTNVCIAMARSQVKSIEDLKQRELIVGSVGTAAGSYNYPKALGVMFGLKFKLIPGYSVAGDIYLALERGELDGFCGSYASIIEARGQWVAEKKMTFLFQGGADRDPLLGDMPFVLDFARDSAERQMLLLLYAGQGMGRPFIAPPDMPPGRLDALRTAFDATMRDAEFVAEVKKMKVDLNPRTGAQLEKLVKDVYATSPELVARLGAMLK